MMPQRFVKGSFRNRHGCARARRSRAWFGGIAAVVLVGAMMRSGPSASSAAPSGSGPDPGSTPVAWGQVAGGNGAACALKAADTGRVLGTLEGRGRYSVVVWTSSGGPRYSIVEKSGRIIGDRLTLREAAEKAPSEGLDGLDAGVGPLMMATGGGAE